MRKICMRAKDDEVKPREADYADSGMMRAEQCTRLAALLRRKMEIENEVAERVESLQIARKTCSKAVLAVLVGRMNELD
jgi:hypothetical protein